MTTGNNPAEFRVAAHYATENLEARILSAFEASGKPRISITLDDLSAVDEFHISGRQATEAIAAQMTESDSFLATVDDYRQGLVSEGISVLGDRQRREFAIEFLERARQLSQQGRAPTLGIHFLMGETAMTKTGNVLEGLRRGVIAPVEIFARS